MKKRHCLNRFISSVHCDDRQELPLRRKTWLKLSPQGRLHHDCNVLGKSVREEVKWFAKEFSEKRLEPGQRSKAAHHSVEFVLFQINQLSLERRVICSLNAVLFSFTSGPTGPILSTQICNGLDNSVFSSNMLQSYLSCDLQALWLHKKTQP